MDAPPMIVDAHLDIAYNALHYGRDPRRAIVDIRAAEGKKTPNGVATVSLPALREANVGLVFATLFALPATHRLASQLGEKMVYRDAAEAHKLAMAQLDYYHRLVEEEENLRLVGDAAALAEVVASHETGETPLLGLAPLMEGAEPIREPEEVEYWYARGLRLIGPAWDDTRYAPGIWRSGEGLTKEGHQLLDAMAGFGFILDITHMSEQAAHEAMDRYEGAVVATHANARTLVPGMRQISDEQIRRLGERDGVIGVVIFNPFLRAHHRKGDARELVTLDNVVAHIDHICQLLGDAAHVGIGSDFDGGFGAADIPAEMDSIADLPLIADRLQQRGYEAQDVASILSGNWLRILQRSFS